MEMTILGSGGFQTIPRPLCMCRVCGEARQKGIPFSRNGPSVFIRGINTLIDTPKDVIASINRENIMSVERIFYTHWHPDHTEGMRVVEEMKTDWSKSPPFELRNHGKPIDVFIPEELKDSFFGIRSPYGPYLSYFEKSNFIRINLVPFGKELRIGKLGITPIKINGSTACYMIKDGKKMAVYMPCDVKPCDSYDFLQGADLLIVGSPFAETKEGIASIPKEHPLREELFSLGEIAGLIKKYSIKKTLVVHIEEMWRLSYDDCTKLEALYKKHNLVFSFDGMNIEL